MFSALGVAFALLFVLLIFPKIFPSMPPAARKSNPLLVKTINKIAAPANWKLIATVLLGLILLFFARPQFDAGMNAMNSVSKETINAEKVLKDTWGNFSGKCYIFLEAQSLE